MEIYKVELAYALTKELEFIDTYTMPLTDINSLFWAVAT